MVRVKAAVVLQDQPVIRSNPGTSLVVQWLRLQVSTAKGEGLIPGLGRSPGEGKGYPLQFSGLENFMDCIVHGVTKSWT